MADDLKQNGKPDDPRINVERDHDVHNWAEWNISAPTTEDGSTGPSNGQGRPDAPGSEGTTRLDAPRA